MLRNIALSFSVFSLVATLFTTLPTHALNKPWQSIPAEQRQILVLKTYQHGLPIPDSIDRGIIAGLRESGGSISDLFTEHLDLDRLPGSEYRAKVANLLRYKLAGRRIGIIIAEGFPAVDFLAHEGKELFPDAPVLTLTTPSIGELSGGSRKVMDIPWRVDPAKTLRIALDLFPNTRLVFVVTGSRDSVLPFLDEDNKAFAPWKGKLDFEYANKMAYDEMMRRISSLPADSIIIYSPYFADVTGRAFVPAEVVARISKSSPVPVFATLEPYLGRGIVGGALLKTEDIGRQVIKITLDYFTGKLKLVKPVTTFNSPIKTMFDWRELTRWNVDTKRIPENSIFISRPHSMWSQYKNIVITAAIIFMVMILLIGRLMIMNKRLKLMTAAANASEEQLNLVIKGSNDAPWDWNLISNELYYSPQWWAQLGYTSVELPADASLWKKLMHPEDTDHFDSVFREALNTGINTYEVEFRLLHKKGHYVSILSRGFITRDENGNPVRVTGTNMDLSERKQAETALRESEERFRLAMKFANDGLFGWNLVTNEIYYSPVWKRLIGYEDDELPNDFSVWETLTHPEDVKRSWKMQNELINGQRDKFKMEFKMKHKDGHWVDILSRANVLFDENNKVVRIIGTHVDITERKQAETILINKKKEAERYLNLAGVMFIGLDRYGNVNIANKKACEVLECTETEIINQNWFDNYIPDRMRNDVRSVFKQLMEGKIKPVEYYENPVLTKIGNEKHIAWHNTIIMDEDNHAIGILGSGEDVTEKLKLQAQLQHAQKMESIGNLAGGIAHDFNNILTAIIGYTELALDETSKGTLLEDSLQEVYSAGKRAKDLVKQILAFARQSDEKMGPIQPRIIVKEVLNFIRSTIPTTIEIQENIKSESLILGNATQVHQVLMNLCTNAAHAMEDSGGTLNISLKDVFVDKDKLSIGMKPGDYVEIKVADTGTGIPPDIIDSIFEPYFTTKAHGEGTGIGLAMVQGVVESYGGKITVDSQMGKGTTFAIYLPITKKRSTQGEYVPEQLPTGTERILFVDDEAPIAKMGGQILERLGYSVTTRTSSIEALELFQTKPNDFDLVVTDMTMPNMTGDKLAVELMKVRPDIPVILCTGYSKKISDETASDICIKAFAYKPVVKADLAKTVRKVLDEANGSFKA